MLRRPVVQRKKQAHVTSKEETMAVSQLTPGQEFIIAGGEEGETRAALIPPSHTWGLNSIYP